VDAEEGMEVEDIKESITNQTQYTCRKIILYFGPCKK
jgi:hypothetical protein